ncbi:hypothetical protein GCK32_021725, partial [Trichostrongylus colubriformis]
IISAFYTSILNYSGSLLDNASIPLIPHLQEVLALGVSLSVCDLFNVTFTTTADQALFDRYKANLACRCPFGFVGDSCEVPAPIPLTLSQAQDHGPPMVIVFAAVLLALFIIVFMVSISHLSCNSDPHENG